MISIYDLKKALLDQAILISDTNSYKLIVDGEEYNPNPNDAYVKEITLAGDDNGSISDDSSDFQIGIYQLSIFTPKVQEGGKWVGSLMSDIYKAGFNKGIKLTYNSQMARIVKSSSTQSDSLDTSTHFATILSVTYSVIN